MLILHEKKDCILKKVEWSEAKVFLDLYHKQGAGKPTMYNYGLYYENELVGLATFGPCRYINIKRQVDWEWMRLCYKKDIIVKGGTDKMLHAFLLEYNGNIISYQFDMFEGKMFKGLGFECISKRKSHVYYNPTTGKETRHRFINDKRDKKLQEYLKNNPDKTVLDYFGYTEKRDDMIVYTWFREKRPLGYIYKIVSPEGKIYVGQKKGEVFVDSYWSSSQNKDFWNDIQKFGKEAFTREVIEWCYTIDELNARETYWIKELNSTVNGNGYNICICFPNIIRTDEVREKLRESSKIYWSNPENHIKASNRLKNSEKFKESRKAAGKVISTSLCNLSEEEKKKKYAFTQTDDFKEKVRQNNIGKSWWNNGEINVFADKRPDETFERGMIKGNKPPRQLSEEHKEKLSKLHAGRTMWTNGIENKVCYECPGEGWYKGRTVKQHGRSWWNNGKEAVLSIECPGKDWVKGNLKGWHPSCTLDEFYVLCTQFSYGKLARLFNVSVATIRGYCIKNGIKKQETRNSK